MTDNVSITLQKLINETASDEDVNFLKQELDNGNITISGNVNQSIIILGNGNKIEITPSALNRLNSDPLSDDVKALLHKTKLILDGIHDKLANEIQISRPKILDDFQQKSLNHKLLIIKGEAGTGKSAFAKIVSTSQF